MSLFPSALSGTRVVIDNRAPGRPRKSTCSEVFRAPVRRSVRLQEAYRSMSFSICPIHSHPRSIPLVWVLAIARWGCFQGIRLGQRRQKLSGFFIPAFLERGRDRGAFFLPQKLNLLNWVKWLYRGLLTEPSLPLISPETLFCIASPFQEEHVLRNMCDLGMTPGLHPAHLEREAFWEVGSRWAEDPAECQGWLLPGLLSGSALRAKWARLGLLYARGRFSIWVQGRKGRSRAWSWFFWLYNWEH